MEPKHSEENNINYNCLCGRQFKLLTSFTKHQKYDCKIFHGTTQHNCFNCGVKFKQARNLIRHMKNNCTTNRSVNTPKKLFSCSFEGCDMQFYKLTSLTDHVEFFHNVEIMRRELIFSNYSEFLKWKQNEEQSTFSYFSKRHSAPVINNDPALQNNQKAFYETYYCQFHGSDKPHHKIKNIKKNRKGRAKTGMVCYAHMYVRVESNESVKVKYVSSHTHPLIADNTKFQPLPQVLKNEILQLNSLNMPLNEIHKRVTRCDISRENRDNPIKGREHFIKLHNIRYLLKTTAEKNEEEDEATIISNIINDLSNETYNPILIYKPQGESIYVDSTSDVLTNDFIFGFQSKEQRDVMLDQETLYADFLYDTEGYGAQILTIVAASEKLNEYPVAHFVVSSTDENILTVCFFALKQKSPSFILRSIVAPDPTIFSIVKAVLNEDCQFFFCHKFVLSEWSRKLWESVTTTFRHQEIMSELEIILKETSEEQFMILTQCFCAKYDFIMPSFMIYFKSYYLNSENVPLWSLIYRNVEIKSNALVSSFHDYLKEKYLKRITEKTLNKLIIAVIETEKDCYAKSKELENDLQLNSTEKSSENEITTEVQNGICNNPLKEGNLIEFEESQNDLINHNKLENINNNLTKLSALLEEKLIQERFLDQIDENLENLVKKCSMFINKDVKSVGIENINKAQCKVSELVEQELPNNINSAKGKNNLLSYELQDHLYCIPLLDNSENLEFGGEIVVSENNEDNLGEI